MSVAKIITRLPGPKAAAIVSRDEKILSPSYTRSYPLVVKKAKGLMIEDVDGNHFLDMTAGIAVTATGHCHPDVVKAIQKQAANLIHMSGTDFYYEVQVELAEKLTAHAPMPGPHKVFYTNSGTEAVEAAIKLSRRHTGRKKIIAFEGSFHGRSCGALSLTSSKRIQKEGFGPLLPGIYHVPFADPRACPDSMSVEDYASQCIEKIIHLFKTEMSPEEVAAVVVEPIQGEGGYIVPPVNFHQEIQTLCRRHGILYVVDEIQAGMGRTGKFFACEHFGVEPDIITMAKGIASGLPLGAMISRASVMDWPPGAHASTFGGNPVACAAAIETVRLVEEGLMKNAAEQGAWLKKSLEGLQGKYPLVTDVRGLGLMLAIEIENAGLRDEIIMKAFKAGLLLLPCGTQSIRISPALTILQEECAVAMEILEDVIRKM